MLDTLESLGFALLRDQPEESILAVAASLGRPLPEPRDGVMVKTIRPTPSNGAVKNTLSERYGMGAFPLHTEAAYWRLPPRFLLLYCRNPGETNRATEVLDGSALLQEQDASLLSVDPWVVSAGLHSFLTTVLSGSGVNRILRYDRDCMRPAVKDSRSRQLLDSFLGRAKVKTISWRAHDLLIVDNHRALHGRAGSAVPDPSRELIKVLVDA